MAEPDETSQALVRLAARLGRRETAGRVLGAVLVAVVAVGAAWLVTPGSDMQRLPGDEALGTPSVGTIKASRDYDIPDEAATRRRREEAAAAERPVYDQDAGALEETAARIRGAFQLMRQADADWRASLPPTRALRRPERDPELRRVWEGQRGAFVARLQAVVRDDDFAALEDARFSEGAEQLLVSLAARGLAGPVVEDLDVLPGERERGIAVRELRAGAAQGEHPILDLALLRDTAQARADVERAGAALPPGISPRLRAALLRLAVASVRPTLVLNQAETQRRQKEAAERVKPVIIPIRRGEKIVGDGDRIEKRHLLIFHGIRAQTRGVDVMGVRVGGGGLVLVLVLLLWSFARRNVAAFRPSRKDAVLLAALFLATLGLAAAGLAAGDSLHDRFPALPPEAFYYLVPFAAGAMVVRSVLSAEIALLFAVAAGAAVGLLAGHSLFFAVHAVLTSVAASGLAARTHDRAGIFRAGAIVGALGALLVAGTYLFTGRGPGSASPPVELAASAGAAFASGAVLLPVLVVVLLPLVERGFGYVTDVRLLELANLNHPALKELIVQAPGTYHHSIIMGSLVETAAEAVGANALLARVCAYYHDLGKIRNPLYFAENQRGENKHEHLAPSMSALIVKRHVTDGLELAAHWRLPRVVGDAIAQHHGTRLVSFFWAKAQAAEPQHGNGSPAALDEGLYRYAGPKPQSREAALVMIADACEASARALPEPTTDRIAALVQRRINDIFSEGQFDECELTLKDLNGIAHAMVRALEAVYHTRPEYPSRPAEPPGGSVHLVAKP